MLSDKLHIKSLRRFFSDAYLKSLRHSARIAGYMLRFLPLRAQVHIKEKMNRLGFLDYKRASVAMVVETPVQLQRTFAVQKEPETVQWLESSFHKDDVLYDIGANVGAYSFVACAAAKNNCSVYSFEPSFSSFSALCENILLNHQQERIFPFYVALSSEDMPHLGLFRYHSIQSGSSLHHLDSHKLPKSDANALLVPAYSLDTFVNVFNLKNPTHLKIDVDGAELEILKGSTHIVQASSLRSVLIEINEEDSLQQEEIIMILQNAGFHLESRHPRKASKTANYIFIRP